MSPAHRLGRSGLREPVLRSRPAAGLRTAPGRTAPVDRDRGSHRRLELRQHRRRPVRRPDQRPTQRGRRRPVLVRVLAALARTTDRDPQGTTNYLNPVDGSTKNVRTLAGHRDWPATECPGNAFYPTLPSCARKSPPPSDFDSQNLPPVRPGSRWLRGTGSLPAVWREILRIMVLAPRGWWPRPCQREPDRMGSSDSPALMTPSRTCLCGDGKPLLPPVRRLSN